MSFDANDITPDLFPGRAARACPAMVGTEREALEARRCFGWERRPFPDSRPGLIARHRPATPDGRKAAVLNAGRMRFAPGSPDWQINWELRGPAR